MRKVLGVVLVVCCGLFCCSSALAMTRSVKARREAARAVSLNEVHPGRTYVSSATALPGVLDAADVGVGTDPRPIADQIEDILETPALQAVFGGYVVQPDGSVTIYVVSGGETLVEGALSALGSAVDGEYTISTVSNSWATLEGDVATISAALPVDYAGSDWTLPQWEPNPTTNSVEFDIQGNMTDAQAQLQAQFQGMPLTFVAAPPGQFMPAKDNRDFDGGSGGTVFRGGDRIVIPASSNQCTDAFAVKGNTSGQIYQVTAGHCGGGTGAIVQTNETAQYGFAEVATDHIASDGLDFEGLTCLSTCKGFVWYENPPTTNAVEGTLRRVNGRCDCGQGEDVTFDGSVTGEATDFPVTTTGVCLNNDDGYRVCNVREAKDSSRTCVQEGDSGGPVYQRDSSDPDIIYATGTIIGWSGSDHGDCYYQALLPELNIANTSVVIGAAGGS